MEKKEIRTIQQYQKLYTNRYSYIYVGEMEVTAPSQDSVNHGLVIKDEKNNEWVWVPVDKATLATMYEESSDEKHFMWNNRRNSSKNETVFEINNNRNR